MTTKNELKLLRPCPECSKPLRYCKSGFEQYQPSTFKCDACGKEYDANDIRWFMKGLESRPTPQNVNRNDVIEECAKVADHQKTICGMSMSRQTTCEDIGHNIRLLKNISSDVPQEKTVVFIETPSLRSAIDNAMRKSLNRLGLDMTEYEVAVFRQDLIKFFQRFHSVVPEVKWPEEKRYPPHNCVEPICEKCSKVDGINQMLAKCKQAFEEALKCADAAIKARKSSNVEELIVDLTSSQGLVQRFQKLSDGWIRDSLNRIEWGPSSGHVMNFDKAKEHCKAAGGRLPTLKELHSIVDYGRNKPAVDTSFFGDTKTDDWYWTDTPVSGRAGYVWCVEFFYGHVLYGRQDNAFYVRPVRPSQ